MEPRRAPRGTRPINAPQRLFSGQFIQSSREDICSSNPERRPGARRITLPGFVLHRKLRYVKQTSAIINCGLRNRRGLSPGKYPRKAERTSWTVEEDAITVVNSKEHPRSVRTVGAFSRSKSKAPILTPEVWNSSLICNARSRSNTQIRAPFPSLDLLLQWPHSREDCRVRMTQIIPSRRW